MYSIQWQYGRDSAHQDCELRTFRLRRERNLPAKAAALSPRKIVKSSLFETDIYCMPSGSFGHLSFKNVGFEIVLKKIDFTNIILLKKIYFSNKARSTIQHTFTKEKKIPGQKGAPGPPLNPPLVNTNSVWCIIITITIIIIIILI